MTTEDHERIASVIISLGALAWTILKALGALAAVVAFLGFGSSVGLAGGGILLLVQLLYCVLGFTVFRNSRAIARWVVSTA